jgi:hypothetical protein
MRTTLLAGAATLALVLATSANAAPEGVKVGVLNCDVESGWGFIVGSSKGVRCAFHPNRGEPDRYEGTISKLGVDIGYTGGGKIMWDVVAPSSDVRSGALQGEYAGATASATAGVGVGANVLVGGLDKSIALQPVSIEGNTGLDIAAGVGALTLKSVEPPAEIHERVPADRGPPPPDDRAPPPDHD